MNVCFAVENEEGLNSVVCRHFHSAPAFVIIDTGSGSVVGLENKDLNHVRGTCDPIMAVGGDLMDAVVVGGMGLPAMTKLYGKGIGVYLAVAETVGQNMDLLKAAKLPRLSIEDGCCGFQGQGCKCDQACARR